MSDRKFPVGAAVASVALFAAAGLTLASESRMPEAGAEPSTTPTSTTPTSTTPTSTSPTSSTPTTTTSASTTASSTSSSPGAYPSDEYGYTDSAARCDDSQTLMAYGRTSRALVAICVGSDGELEYRGVRLSDETSLTAPAGRAADDAIIATNNGVTYAVSPEMLLVSEGDTVLYRDSWLEFHEPRFSAEPTTSSENSPPRTSSSPTPTVSTTTVTVTSQTSDSGE